MTRRKTVGPAAVVAFFGVSAVVRCVFEGLDYHKDEKSYSGPLCPTTSFEIQFRRFQSIIQRMPSTESCFTPLESAVLRAICEKESVDRDRTALEAQLSAAVLVSRKNTGAGFYTSFAVDRGSSAPVGGERLRNGPAMRIDGLRHGMGFILWLKDGYLELLEGYSYEESTVEIDFERAGFDVVK